MPWPVRFIKLVRITISKEYHITYTVQKERFTCTRSLKDFADKTFIGYMYFSESLWASWVFQTENRAKNSHLVLLPFTTFQILCAGNDQTIVSTLSNKSNWQQFITSSPSRENYSIVHYHIKLNFSLPKPNLKII